ncbi:MAG TPA: hypothetical protein VHQ47_11475 [Phycisphaerae bacterium]|nr:hypothetical protein [Phycisphaerae bacterium]
MRDPRELRRWDAVLLLRQKRTAGTVAGLRELVARGPGAITVDYSTDFFTDAVAQSALESWGEAVVGPALRPSARWFDPGEFRGWLSLVGLIVFPIMMVWNRRHRWRFFHAVMALGFSFVLVIAIRSFGNGDALQWNNKTLISSNGNIYFNSYKRADVTVHQPLLYCRSGQLPKLMPFREGWRESLWGWGSDVWWNDWSDAADQPYWVAVGAWRVPLWFALGVLGSPWLYAGACWLARRLRRREVRGFPVEAAQGQRTFRVTGEVPGFGAGKHRSSIDG